MSGERKIVVAVDEGEESEYALSWCLKHILLRAGSTGTNSKDILILLYAKPHRAGYAAFDETGYLFSTDVIETMEKYNNKVAQCVMNKANRICNDMIKDNVKVKVETMVLTGDPRDVICETAEKLGVDLLVMGSHGYGLIKRAFLGSVSNHCAQNVKCPVLIVKTPKPTLSLTPPPPPPPPNT